jgi:hypothetical protein
MDTKKAEKKRENKRSKRSRTTENAALRLRALATAADIAVSFVVVAGHLRNERSPGRTVENVYTKYCKANGDRARFVSRHIPFSRRHASMSGTVLVGGGSGFVGSVLCKCACLQNSFSN